MSNFTFARPADPAPVQARESVAGACPECGHEALKRYPVLAEHGWFMVVKCQDCLCSVDRDRWARLGPVRLMTDDLR